MNSKSINWEKLFSLPEDISTHGAAIDNLIGYMHILMLVLFVGWGCFFIYVLIRFRAGRQPKADYHGVKSHVSSYLEVCVALIEAVLLVGFSIPIYARVVAEKPDPAKSVVVRVWAQQFTWVFQYAGPDGKFGKFDPKKIDPVSNANGLDNSDPNAQDDYFTYNDMTIPKDRPVIAHVTAKDVIHNFAVPNLRVKQDAIPGMEFPIWFQATKEGTYDIACSQLCGENHFAMIGKVVVKSQADFDKWTSEQTAEVNNIF